jgi:hypothetical protein
MAKKLRVLELIYTLNLIGENVRVGIQKNIKVKRDLDGDRVFLYKTKYG